jgi:hypothetical protein
MPAIKSAQGAPVRDYTPEYESFQDDALAVLSGAAVTVAVTGFWWKPVYAGPIALAIAVIAYFLTPRARGGTIIAVAVITLLAMLGRWIANYPVVLEPLAGLGRRQDRQAVGDRAVAAAVEHQVDAVLGLVAAPEHQPCVAPGGHPARRHQLVGEHQVGAAHLEVDALLFRHTVDEHLEGAFCIGR